ncbi:MAG: M23 family metallopeptidase, partial [Actinomycetota bacterium]
MDLTRRHRLLGLSLAVALVAGGVPSSAAAVPKWLVPPVDAPIKRGFELPKGEFGPGNRGVDYAVVEGS